MKPESLVLGVAGALFGLLCGWIIGAQHAAPAAGPTPTSSAVAAPAPAQGQSAAGGAQGQGGTPARATLDPARAQALEAQAGQRPQDAEVRSELANLYFDAERYADAARWYEASLQVAPRNADVSTDLAICYYYLNQADRALTQFAVSLAIDPKHTKTLLNLGIVRAFGKQDLAGAAAAWQQVVALAPPDSAEARAARQALEGVKAAHPEIAPGTPPAPAAPPSPSTRQGV